MWDAFRQHYDSFLTEWISVESMLLSAKETHVWNSWPPRQGYYDPVAWIKVGKALAFAHY